MGNVGLSVNEADLRSLRGRCEREMKSGTQMVGVEVPLLCNRSNLRIVERTDELLVLGLFSISRLPSSGVRAFGLSRGRTGQGAGSPDLKSGSDESTHPEYLHLPELLEI
jgi:hypothetical protein